jgi:flagella basal body P-ring formation protein FlgA
MVSRNTPVTIYYRNGPLTLTVKGKALEGGARGESVQVLNLLSRKVVNAVAVAEGTVEISSPTQTVAGL